MKTLIIFIALLSISCTRKNEIIIDIKDFPETEYSQEKTDLVLNLLKEKPKEVYIKHFSNNYDISEFPALSVYKITFENYKLLVYYNFAIPYEQEKEINFYLHQKSGDAIVIDGFIYDNENKISPEAYIEILNLCKKLDQ
mgnify:CR=1 FL=1